jgi:hypothetical protein
MAAESGGNPSPCACSASSIKSTIAWTICGHALSSRECAILSTSSIVEPVTTAHQIYTGYHNAHIWGAEVWAQATRRAGERRCGWCSAVQCSVCVFALDRGVDQPPVLCAHEAVLRAMQLRRDACVSLHSLCTHCEIHSPCLIQGELGPASTPLGAPLRWAWIMSVTGRYAPPRRAFWTYRPC